MTTLWQPAPITPASPPRWWSNGNWPAGPNPPRPGPRRVHRTGLDLEGGIRRHHHPPVAADGRLGGLDRERFTMDDGLSAAVRRCSSACTRRADLSRPAAGQLGPGAAHRRLRIWVAKWSTPRKADSCGTSATRWPNGRRRSDRRHHPPGNHAGRYRRAVHPDDERYKHPIGKMPFYRRRPDAISPSSPTTTWTRPSAPAASRSPRPTTFNDYAVGQRHSLPLINIFTPSARINDNAPGSLSRSGPLRGPRRSSATGGTRDCWKRPGNRTS